MLQFIVKNGGPVDAENLSVAVSFSKEFSVVPHPDWEKVAPMGIVVFNSVTNEFHSSPTG
jgi:hypothetical protein